MRHFSIDDCIDGVFVSVMVNLGPDDGLTQCSVRVQVRTKGTIYSYFYLKSLKCKAVE